MQNIKNKQSSQLVMVGVLLLIIALFFLFFYINRQTEITVSEAVKNGKYLCPSKSLETINSLERNINYEIKVDNLLKLDSCGDKALKICYEKMCSKYFNDQEKLTQCAISKCEQSCLLQAAKIGDARKALQNYLDLNCK